MHISLTNQLPLTHTKKILKKPTPKDASCLVVLVDDEQNILGGSLGDYQTRIEQLIEVSHFKGKAGETVVDYALAGDKKTPKQNPFSYCLLAWAMPTN